MTVPPTPKGGHRPSADPLPMAKPNQARAAEPGPGPGSIHPARPYLAVLGLALIVAAMLAAYLSQYRDEIARLIFQAPT